MRNSYSYCNLYLIEVQHSNDTGHIISIRMSSLKQFSKVNAMWLGFLILCVSIFFFFCNILHSGAWIQIQIRAPLTFFPLLYPKPFLGNERIIGDSFWCHWSVGTLCLSDYWVLRCEIQMTLNKKAQLNEKKGINRKEKSRTKRKTSEKLIKKEENKNTHAGVE